MAELTPALSARPMHARGAKRNAKRPEHLKKRNQGTSQHLCRDKISIRFDMFVRPENPRSARFSETGDKRRFFIRQDFSLTMKREWQFNPVTICQESAESTNYKARLAAA